MWGFVYSSIISGFSLGDAWTVWPSLIWFSNDGAFMTLTPVVTFVEVASVSKMFGLVHDFSNMRNQQLLKFICKWNQKDLWVEEIQHPITVTTKICVLWEKLKKQVFPFAKQFCGICAYCCVPNYIWSHFYTQICWKYVYFVAFSPVVCAHNRTAAVCPLPLPIAPSV